MTVLEATVEIVKSAMSSDKDAVNKFILEKDRQEFLEGVKGLYNTIKELEKDSNTDNAS